MILVNTFICARCGESFENKKPREYCSNSCRVTIQRRRKQGLPAGDVQPICERCNHSFEAIRNTAKRCQACQGLTTPIFDDQTCPVCQMSFTPSRYGQVNCSNACAQKAFKDANWRKYYEPWNDRRRANHHKRRALKMELPADNIRPLEVYERDEWICGLCDKPVDRDSKWPAPLSPSLDHVTPLSLGGHHVYENVQLAHLRCNVSKGARVEVQ